MYKYYEKNNYALMYYEFDSIYEYIEYLDNSKTSATWNNKNLHSMIGDYSFCKTKSFEEAKQLCKYGQQENFQRLVDLKLELEKYIKIKDNKLKQINSYVGYAPDVKAYLEGFPLTMYNKETPKRKHIDIYYNAAIPAIVNPSEIYNRGAITLSIIEILENLGYSVGLNVFTMSKNSFQIHYAKFNLKKPGERINIQKLFFPLCNPSFLRRLGFRLREVTPDTISSWVNGYGETCGNSLIRDILDLNEDDIVISIPYEMGIRGVDIIKDAESMFKYINSLSEKDFELKGIDKEETQNIDTAYSNDCVISLKPTKYIKKRKII